MNVQVCLLGGLSRFTSGRAQLDVVLNYSNTVDNVLRKLKIPNKEVLSIFINQKLVINKEVVLKEGDKIVFLPVVGGG